MVYLLQIQLDSFTFSHESQLGRAQNNKENRSSKNDLVATTPH